MNNNRIMQKQQYYERSDFKKKEEEEENTWKWNCSQPANKKVITEGYWAAYFSERALIANKTCNHLSSLSISH